MGWERKRGKLEQFNAYILHGISTPFSVTAGRIDTLRKCRFVVTADADTRLPPGVVRRLVGTLAHPLNKARFDPASGQVERGYTIIQPRVELAPDTTGQSLFSRRSEEHTSELQSLMRISYAVFCLKKKKRIQDETRKLKYTKH